MQIKESGSTDVNRIFKLHLDAFGETEGPVVARLALDLLEDQRSQFMLSLIAQENEELVGHILFTGVSVSDCVSQGGYILAPLAVSPRFQRQGIGIALIKHGLDILRNENAEYVLVLGDPAYYKPAGFSDNHRIEPPYAIDYPEAWMAQELKQGAMSKIVGTVHCAAPLQAREHW